MRVSEIAVALGVALAVLVVTLVASFPLVAFYATFIEPGHPPDFYREAALWLAPWSSYILGPIGFYVSVYLLTGSRRVSRPRLFAVLAFTFYMLVDIVLLPIAMDIPIGSMITGGMLLTLSTKLAAALLGAQLGLSRLVEHRAN